MEQMLTDFRRDPEGQVMANADAQDKLRRFLKKLPGIDFVIGLINAIRQPSSGNEDDLTGFGKPLSP